MAETTGLQAEVELLFAKYKDKVYHLAISMVHNDKDAEDIAQNTFMKVLKNLRYFRHQSNISTWIYRITYNESLMYLRRKYRQFRLANRAASEAKILPTGMFINWSKVSYKELLEEERKSRLQDAIRHIPIKYRMPLLLHHIEDMPLRQSAEILGISLSSLKSRLHRSILMISSALFDYLKDKKEKEERPKEKGCPLWLGFVYDYARGNLNSQTKRDFKKHISDCNGCRKFMDDYGRAAVITEALECQDIPSELQSKLESFILKHRKSLRDNLNPLSGRVPPAIFSPKGRPTGSG